MSKNYLNEIAQLKEKGMSQRRIAEILGISRNTVKRVYGILNDDVKSEKLPDKRKAKERDDDYFLPDFAALAKELVKPGVTMKLLHEEYVASCLMSHKKAYKITQFKKHFNDYLGKVQFTDIIRHKAAERIEVDWAGNRPFWFDEFTGEKVYGYLFVGVLSFSGLAFARATVDMKMPNWIDCHVKMYEYFGGVSKILVPDNLKTGVTKHSKDEIVINKTYEDMANYYGTIIIPARVKRPKDKSKVENTVYRLEVDILARLRNMTFFSCDEYNEAIIRELKVFNERPFQKKEGSRYQVYLNLEKDALYPLPIKPYELATYKSAKVQVNSCIAYKKNFYSVPYEYIGKEVELKITDKNLYVLLDKEEIARHEIVKDKIGHYSIEPSHMPESSNAYGKWNKERYLNWANNIGPSVYKVVFKLFESAKNEVTRYRKVHSLLKLADLYSASCLDKACQLSLSITPDKIYRHVKDLLKNGDDLKSEDDNISYTFLRGGDYFE